MSDRLTCPACGGYWDTPTHEWGCAAGRKAYGHIEWYPEDESEDDEDGES